MTHHEQALAHYEAGDYEAALDAFELALEAEEESAALWRDVGRTHIQLEDWESAEAALDEATALDERDAQAWYAKGNVYQATGDAATALKAYETALVFEPDWALPWLAKGAIYLTMPDRGEDGLRHLKRALHLDAGKTARHMFAIFTQLPPMPFLSYRLIRDYMMPWGYQQHEDYVRHTFELAQPLRAFLSAYERLGDADSFTIGLLHFYLGDPEFARKAFDKVDPTQQEISELQLLYYGIQASYGFAEDDELDMDRALELAAQYLPQEQSSGWGLFKKKKAVEAPPLAASEWEACYYAGLIYVENDQLDEALRCFERIEEDYLPALYQAMWVYEEKVNTKKKKEKAVALLAREAENPAFSVDYPVHELSLERGQFDKQMRFCMRYQELAEAIELLHFYAEFEADGQEVALPSQQPAVFERWTMSEELHAKIQEDSFAQLKEKLQQQKEAIEPPPPSPADAAAEADWYQALGQWLESSEASDEQAYLHLNALMLQSPLPADLKIALDAYVFCRGGRVADWPKAIVEGAPFGTGIGMGRYLGEAYGLSDESWESWSEAAGSVWAYASGLDDSSVAWEKYQAAVLEFGEEE
jgi:tetratricopeptide (TPR) repeat protein